MKYFATLISICVLLTIGCTPEGPNSGPAADFDLTGYETTAFPNGVTRVQKRDQNGVMIEEGYLKDGKKEGVWTTYSAKRPQSVTSYIDGHKYGKELVFSSLLQITDEATYTNDILNGRKGRYKRGRPLEEGYFIENKPHGVQKLYFESGADQGKLRQFTEYNHGQIHGKLKMYNASGEVTIEYDYKNGEKISGGIVK